MKEKNESRHILPIFIEKFRHFKLFYIPNDSLDLFFENSIVFIKIVMS